MQFHPEFTGDIMRAYLSEYADSLRSEGRDVAAMQKKIDDTVAVNTLLKRFYAYCAGKQERLR